MNYPYLRSTLFDKSKVIRSWAQIMDWGSSPLSELETSDNT